MVGPSSSIFLFFIFLVIIIQSLLEFIKVDIFLLFSKTFQVNVFRLIFFLVALFFVAFADLLLLFLFLTKFSRSKSSRFSSLVGSGVSLSPSASFKAPSKSNGVFFFFFFFFK